MQASNLRYAMCEGRDEGKSLGQGVLCLLLQREVLAWSGVAAAWEKQHAGTSQYARSQVQAARCPPNGTCTERARGRAFGFSRQDKGLVSVEQQQG